MPPDISSATAIPPIPPTVDSHANSNGKPEANPKKSDQKVQNKKTQNAKNFNKSVDLSVEHKKESEPPTVPGATPAKPTEPDINVVNLPKGIPSQKFL